MKLIKKLPVPICGLALGLVALGNLLMSYAAALRYVCGGLGAVLLLGFILRIFTDFKGIQKELQNPVAFSVLPTFTMALMLLAAYVRPLLGIGATALWFCALAGQVLVVLAFVKKFVFAFSIKNVFPSWFIAGVGFVVASVTAPAMGQLAVGRAVFYVGFALYLVLLGPVVYRVVKVRQIPQPALPTVAIFCAPAGLCLAGYLSAFESINTAFFYILLGLCLVSYLVVLVSMVWLLRVSFCPGYSSYTFPFVICAIGIKLANARLVAAGSGALAFLVPAATVIAVAGVGYVLVRYLLFLAAAVRQNT